MLHLLLANTQRILGDRFVGLYLYGSLASGDFDPCRSDIDFVVVTAIELPGETISALAAMHERIAASGLQWAAKLEGAYIPQATFRRHDPCAAYPYINEGHFQAGQEGSDWVIQRHIIREQGVVVAGPAPQDLIDPIQPDDLRRAVLAILREWWAPMLHDPAWLRSHGSEYQAFAVLTMCRALYTLQTGNIVSKPAAARWAQEMLDERWAALIQWALTWQPAVSVNKLAETLDFIQHTLERSEG